MSITKAYYRHIVEFKWSDCRLAVAGEYGFDDLGLEQFATDIDFNFVANLHAERQAGEGDGLLQNR